MKTLRFLILPAVALSLFCRTGVAATGSATVGQSVVISVTSDGTPPLSYQWNKNGTAIPGATLATLTLAPVALADAGTYTVRVANAAGNVLSDAATLTVNPQAPTRAITSFTIGAAPSSTAAPLLAK